VALASASEKVALTVASGATPVSSASGLRELTVGATVSTVIVRSVEAGEVLSAASVAVAR
jgi:hypothetical protein